MLEAIVNHLQETYRPVAILFHGSRARGKAREHSDWDFILLYTESDKGRNGREVYESQNVEFSAHVLPIANIEDEFSGKLLGAKVVYEEGTLGSDLLQQASAYYRQGVHWPSQKIYDHKLWVQGRIDGMQDNVDSPIVFSKYYADFYQRIFNYWYWILQQTHSQPVYVAVEEVAEKDPEYYELVEHFTNPSVSLEEKAATAQKIRDRLFS